MGERECSPGRLCARDPPLPVAPLCAWGERAERSEAGLGTTKEVLGLIIRFLAFNLDFLGFRISVLGFPRISVRILSGFRFDFGSI